MSSIRKSFRWRNILLFLFLLLGRELAGVATLSFGIDLEFEEPGTEAPDLLACGAQKWLLSPWGSGFLYVRRDLIPELAPAFTGWMAFRGTDDFTRLTDYDPTFHADARRFELITLPFQDMAGMTASLRLLLGIGIAEIAAHLRALRLPLATAADTPAPAPGIKVIQNWVAEFGRQ